MYYCAGANTPIFVLRNLVVGTNYVMYRAPMVASCYAQRAALNVVFGATSTSTLPVSLRTAGTNTPVYDAAGTALTGATVAANTVYTLNWSVPLGGYQVVLINGATPTTTVSSSSSSSSTADTTTGTADKAADTAVGG